jgi:hypothetical protein
MRNGKEGETTKHNTAMCNGRECYSTYLQEKKELSTTTPASRHRSVLALDHVVPLFDMQVNMSNSIDGIIRSSQDARPIQRLTTITTNSTSQVVEVPRYVELLVSFYSPPAEEDSNNFIKNDFKVIMPRTWTPKMYLGVLHQST